MQIKKCGRCPLWFGKERCISGFGNPKSDIFVIPESPGKTEIDEQTEDKPLIGLSGAVFNWAGHKAGLFKPGRRSEVYITNAVKCYPSISESTTNPVDITNEHKKKCRVWLKKEINYGKPKHILILGKHALHSVSGDYTASIEEKRGFWYWSDEFQCWYFPTIHPANVIRNWGKTSSFYRDIEYFTKCIKEGFEPPSLKNTKYKIVRSIKELKKFKNIINKKNRISWDTETSSLKYWDHNAKNNQTHILGFGFCWEEKKAIYIPLFETGEDGLTKLWSEKEEKVVIKTIKEILENQSIKKDGQNTKFDINWARAYGITVKNIDWDTMQFHHLIDENTPTNLTYLTSYYRLGFPKYDDKIKPYLKSVNGKKTYMYVPTDILGKYCCADCDAVFRISKMQRKLASKRQKNLYYKFSVPLSKLTAEMEWNGVLIDVEKIDKMEKEYQKNIDKVNKKLAKMVKLKELNVQSQPQLRKVLFGSERGCLKLKPVFKTKKGEPSTNKQTFEMLRRKYKNRKKVMKVLDLIEEIRKMRKLKSTYLTGFKKLVDENNRIHTSYLTTGTVTGRLASESPNLQNIPRIKIFRSLFIAGKGNVFIAADYSQIEARMMPWMANEVKYINKFKDPNFDPHTYNSSVVRGKKMEDITKEERSYDKAVTFGINYGRSAKSISEEYEIPLSFVEDFIKHFFLEFKNIYKWRKKQIFLSKKNLYLETPTGRRRHFDAYKWIYSDEMKEVLSMLDRIGLDTYAIKSVIGNMERQAINYKIQSFSSDMLVKALYKFFKRTKKEKIDALIVLTVHDMGGIVSSKKHLKKTLKVLNNTMPFSLVRKFKNGKTIKLDFPIDYDVKDYWVQ